jgi:2,5-dioxopentanoate dehydrogenase
MAIYGEMFIGGTTVRGSLVPLHGLDPATGAILEPAFGSATAEDLDRACALAADAFDTYRETAPDVRAAFLEKIATNILEVGDELIDRAMRETGLPRARLEGERARTVAQLRLFAQTVLSGRCLELRIDPAQPQRKPLSRPDLRLRMIALGPVAVFGSSNFPLAFSIAGGDTAAALAAGCPVVAKAHPAHPGTSELVGRALQHSVRQCGLPPGVFSMLFDSGHGIGQQLVADPRIKAVAFTGSRRGGMALMKTAQQRADPIPVYAEMSSINPVILLPNALEEKAEAIAAAFVASLTLGAGQFCTNPGLVLGIEGRALARFEAAAADGLARAPAATMLTAGIYQAYETGLGAMQRHAAVTTLARGLPGQACTGQAALFATGAQEFCAHPALQDEIFGAASLIVRCPDLPGLVSLIDRLEGQLTTAIHMVEADVGAARQLLPRLEKKAGRILVNGFGTGVEVTHAMVHGGPFPSTSDGRSTSVGSLAVARFLRPVAYQDVPDALLPDSLKNANPFGFERMVDGITVRP